MQGTCERALGSYVVGGVPIYALIPVGRYSREASPSFLVREREKHGTDWKSLDFKRIKRRPGGGENNGCYTKLYGI